MNAGQFMVGLGFVIFVVQLIMGLGMIAADVPRPPTWLWAMMYSSFSLMIGGMAVVFIAERLRK